VAKDIVTILPDFADKVGNMRQTAVPVRDAEQAGYAHYMAQMLTASESQREENRRLQEIRRKRHGVDPHAQPASTQAILTRPKEKDLEHFLRPLPESEVKRTAEIAAALAAKPLALKEESAAINQLTGKRDVPDDQKDHIEAIRRRPKNSKGQSDKSAFDQDHSEAAANAFVCSPGVTLEQLSDEDKKRITKPIAYAEEPKVAIETPKPKPTEKTFWTHGHFLELKNWFRK